MVEFTEMSLNADRAGKLLLGFPTTCKDHPRTFGSHPLRLSDEEMSSVTGPSGTITAGRAASVCIGTEVANSKITVPWAVTHVNHCIVCLRSNAGGSKVTGLRN